MPPGKFGHLHCLTLLLLLRLQDDASQHGIHSQVCLPHLSTFRQTFFTCSLQARHSTKCSSLETRPQSSGSVSRVQVLKTTPNLAHSATPPANFHSSPLTSLFSSQLMFKWCYVIVCSVFIASGGVLLGYDVG